MPIGIAFIRGINVGGKNSLPMAMLRELCEGLGLRDARTYIQSGNVVFRCDQRTIANAAATLTAAIEDRLAFRPSVVVRTIDELAAAASANPFASRKDLNKSRCLIMFLASEPSAAAQRAIKAIKSPPDEVRLIGREAFLHLPTGIADATLSMSQVERALAVEGTCRNLITVEKVLNMASELSGG